MFFAFLFFAFLLCLYLFCTSCTTLIIIVIKFCGHRLLKSKRVNVIFTLRRGAFILGGLGEQSPTFLKVGVEGLVISTNMWRLDRQTQKAAISDISESAYAIQTVGYMA